MKEKLEEGLAQIQQSLNNIDGQIAKLEQQRDNLKEQFLRQEGALFVINQMVESAEEPTPEEEAPEGVS
jgi:predicted  nucleic acid-binding Zn-ribbon protein